MPSAPDLQGSSPSAQPAGLALAASPDGGEGCQKSLQPGVQSKRSAAGRPGVGGKPARQGRFSEINTVAGWLPASRGPVKTLSRLARRCRQARTAGKVLRNQHWGRKFAYIQNSCPEAPPRRCRQALTAGRLSEINTGAGNSPLFKTRAWKLQPGVGGKP